MPMALMELKLYEIGQSVGFQNSSGFLLNDCCKINNKDKKFFCIH